MRKKREDKLPPLCAAVRHVREKWRDTQERFARRIGVAVMTVSRFETGRAEPRDPRVLLNLAKVTSEQIMMCSVDDIERKFVSRPFDDGVMTLSVAEQLFRDAYEDYARLRQTDRSVGELESQVQPVTRSMREWRLSCAARLVVLHFPEQVAAMEKAAGAAIALIDEVLAKADENQIDYAQFERDVFALAERRALLELKKGKKEQ
jgi:transcriptional regulator with XRE-family HTH domain